MSALTQQSNSYAKANFRSGFSNKKIWIILILANIFALPYAMLKLSFGNDGSILGLALTAFALVVNVVMGMVIPILQFDYLYDRTKVDMAYSLPLTRKQKFYSDFFSGLAMYVGAYVIQIVLTYISTAIFTTVNSKSTLFRSYYGYRLTQMDSSYVFITITRVLFIILLMQIMLYVVTSFVAACTGSIFETVTATIYTNILIPSTLYVVYTLCTNQFFGLDYSDVIENVIYRTSPLGGFLYLINYVGRGEAFLAWMITYSIVIVLMFFAVYFIMIRRRAEAVGTPFVVRGFYHAILVVVMLHIGLLAYFTGNSLASFILMTAVFYFIVETITNRGFKKIGKSFMRYGIIIVSVLVVILTINKTNCFGISYRVANADKVDKIRIDYNGLFGEYYTDNVIITQPEDIKTILTVQKQLIDDYKEQKKNSAGSIFNWGTNENVSYGYSVSSGLRMQTEGKTKYSRYYDVDFKYMLQLVDVELSDEYIDTKVDAFEKQATYLIASDIYNMNQKTIVMDSKNNRSPLLKEFFECYRADLKKISKEEYLRPSTQIKYEIDSNEGRLVILDSYTNCINFLSNNGVNLEMSTEDYRTIVKAGVFEISEILDEYTTAEDGIYSTRAYYYVDNNYLVNNFSADVETLLKIAQAQYVSEEPCYSINVYGEKFIIPAEYSDVVERVIKNDSTSTSNYYKQ